MSLDETKTDTLKRATRAVLKALSGRHEMAVNYSRGLEVASLSGATAVLPEPTEKPSLMDIQRLRGHADTVALRLLHHDQRLHSRMAPGGSDARKIFAMFEQVRCEALGAAAFPGARGVRGS